MRIFADCEKGQTAAQTGCTPASGEGGGGSAPSMASIGEPMASQGEAQAQAKVAKSVVQGVGEAIQQGDAQEAHGLYTSVGERLGAYAQNVADFAKSPKTKEAVQGLGNAALEIARTPAKVFETIRSSGAVKKLGEVIQYLHIFDANVY